MSKNNRNLKISNLLRILLTAVFVIGAMAAISQAAPIAVTNVTECVNSEGEINCEGKSLITVPVSFGLPQYLDVAIIDTVVDTGGGETQPLMELFRVEIVKSVPQLMYPLRYFHTVAYAPHEEVRKVPHFISGCPGCTACADENSPTCGWTLNAMGARIPYSQGFCSIKSLEELEHGGCSLWRGEEFFGQANMDNLFSTGHAMRLGSVFFEGYEIGEYLKSYEITVRIYKGNNLEHEFTLAPNKPYYISPGNGNYSLPIKATLLGDMDLYEGATELDNYILYIPVSPSTHPMVRDYQHNMLLVPREEVSKDGGEPDKVGVSFHTFRLLGSDCKVSEAGDGLGNQLYHKYNSDLAKLIANPNAETTYLVSGKNAFKGSMNFTAGMPKVLVRNINQINNSLVALTVNTAEVKTIENEAAGWIREAYVNPFSSMSNDGRLVVTIQNVGNIRCSYIVSVTDVTPFILNAFPAQARTLEPQERAILYFDVSTVQNFDATHKVIVTMRTTTGKVIDNTEVWFDTRPYNTKYSWDLRQKNQDSSFDLPDDNSPPVIIINGPNMISLECGVDSYTELGAEAADDTDPNIEVEISGTVDTSACGTYLITYTAKDSTCNTAKAVRVVQVRDTIAPVIILNGPSEVVIGCGTGNYTEEGATATDNCDKNIPIVTGGGVVDGAYVITYNATDDSGNAAQQVTRKIIMEKDTIPPVFDLSVEPKVLSPVNHKMVLIKPTWTVSDNCDESPTVSLVSIVSSDNNQHKCRYPRDKHDDIKIEDNGSIYLRAECGGKVGDRVYTITYQAVDNSGNVTVKTATVKVPCGSKK
jgi:hypothetical protein